MAARRRRVLLDVGGSSGEARREIRQVRDDLRRLGREEVEARIDINERVVLAKLDKVQERITRLKQQPASVNVDVKLAGAFAQLDRLNLRLDRLRAKRINVDVDVRRGALERAASGLGAVNRGVSGITRGFANIFHQVPIVGGLLESVLGGVLTLATNVGSAVGDLATSGIGTLSRALGGAGALAGPIGAVVGQVASLGLSLASVGVVAAGVVVALNAVLGAIIALSSALVALLASAVAAAAGLGALAVAFGAALIPVAIVGIAVFTRFQAILKAHQALQQQVASATQDAKTAEQQRKSAIDSSKRAHEQLAQATVDGNRAMEQSAIDLRDAELGLQRSRLGVKEARLSLKEARQSLREFLHTAGAAGPTLNSLEKKFSNVDFDPSRAGRILGAATGQSAGDPLELQRRVLAVQGAQLGVKEAINQTAHAERTLAQATRTRANFVRQGVSAYRPYRQALEAVRRADERVARAQDRVSAAQRKYDQALRGLSTTEQGSLTRLNAIVDGFGKLAKALTDPIFRALNSVFDSLRGHAGTFETALRQVGDAIAGVVGAIGGFLTEPRTLSAFKTMAAGAADLVRQLGARAFISFLTIMREVATTALPAVRSGARRIADALEHVAGNARGVRSVVRHLVGHFKTWAGLAWQVLRAVVGVFRGAAGPGKSLAGHLTTIVRKFADWANSDEGQRKLRAFFVRMVDRARRIVHWVIQAVIWLKDHLPAAAATAKEALGGVYDVAKKIYDTIKGATELLHGDFSAAAESFGVGSKKDFNKQKGDKGDSFSKRFLKGLLGFAGGGIVPGSGTGDSVVARLTPGEGVLKRNVVAHLGAGVVDALNAGFPPALAMAGPSAAPVVNINNRFSAPGGRAADMRAAAAELEREIWKAVR